MSKAIIPLAIIAILAATLLTACTTPGPGSIITEEKNFADFTYVDVEGIFDVEIVKSDSYSITIRADSNYSDYVDVSQEGDLLKISLNPRHAFTDFTIQARTLKAEITMPALYGLDLSGASKATVSGFGLSEDFILNVSGASSVNMGKMKVGSLNGEVSGASKLGGSINATDVRFDVSGASRVELDGSAKNIVLAVSGASKVDLADFPLDDASINLSGASEAIVHVKGKLDGKLSAASRLYFQGNPTMGDIKVSGASTIKHR